jgi:nitrite reductase (NO-forming)
MFNGEVFRYVKEPIPARPGDYVRFYYLNVGPNLTSTFHAVGGIWDYAYYGGNPANIVHGTQSVVSGPSDSWVIDWVVPAEGPFTLVSHAFGTQAIKGAIGIIDAREDAPRVGEVLSTGPTTALAEDPKRFVDPFGLGDETLDAPVRFREGDRPQIQMVGNSYWPKRAEVPVGSTVTWVNEDVFDFLEGERTGQHNAVTWSPTARNPSSRRS